MVLDSIKQHISYAFKCDSTVEKLKEQTEQLAMKRVRLQQFVDEAERNGEHIYENVTNWLSSAKTEIQEAEQLIQSKEVKKKCCVGLCPNLKTCYQLSKKAAKKAMAIEEPLTKKEFDPISFRPPLQQIVYSMEALPSRVTILNQVMDALKGPYLNMIGIYGMGGIGKTTLAKEVYRKAVEEELFDCVVMVTVSRTPDLRRIQAEIANFLGLEFDAEEVLTGRANRLYQILADTEALIILDDIWAELDLRSVGIPFGDELKRSKILLTSRRKDVLCSEMGKTKDFSLEVLHENEARSLFEMTTDEAKDLELRAIANEVVERCAGLPLLVIIVATYLKNRELSAWRDTLKKLFDFGNQELHEKVHEVLKSIYESLPSNEVKSFFLLCALFGGSNIPVNHLLTYAMGLGLFGNNIKLQDAREKLFQMIEKLRKDSLLLDGDVNGYVKMHNVVLDVARSIATKEQHAFYGISGHGLREWPSRDSTRIALPYYDINELPQGLEYPKAELFSLFSKDLYLGIPDLFFEGFRELKVLNLTGMCFIFLPTSLHFLTNLHSLYLHRCQLDNVAIIGGLKQLEFLSFAESYIVELPKQIEQLSQLKLLDLTNCTQLKVFPANVLSKLSLLKELYMDNSFVKWDVEGNISVMELEELCHLTTLEIQLIDAKRIPKRLFFRRLQRYKISIGDGWAWDWTYEASKALKLTLKTVIHMTDGLKELLRGTQALYIDNIGGIQNLLHDTEGKDCQQLKHLHVRNDNVIPHIIDSTMWASVFPVLETLSLVNLNNLEEICHSQLAIGSFRKLRILEVNGCNKLGSLLSYSCAKCLVQLQEMVMKYCDNMEAIIDEGSEDGNYNNQVIFPNLTSLIVSKCGRLKYIFKSSTVKSLLQLKRLEIECCDSVKEIILTEESSNEIVFSNLDLLCLANLPNLKKFSNGYPVKFQSHIKMEIEECHKLSNISNRGDNIDIKSFFNDTVTFPNLQIMRVSDMEKLKYIWHTSQLTADSFCKLKSLTISNCRNLLSVFSSNVVRRFQRLENLDICNCPKTKEIYQLGELNSNEVVPFEVRHLKIKFMASLKRIWSKDGDGHFNFQNLKSVEAHNCEAMKYVFPASIACNLSLLEKLDIWNCRKVEHIIAKGKIAEFDDEAPQNFNFSELTFLRLGYLRRLKRFYPKTYYCEWPSLKYLKVHGCREAIKLDVEVNSNLKALMLEKLVLSFSSLEYMESILLDDETTAAEEENATTILPLKYLEVEHCDRLKYIIPSLVSFQNLTTLHVAHCYQLKNLVTISSAKTMVCLMELRITHCEMMKEIVVMDEDDKVHNEIIFNQLKTLKLQCFPMLKYFIVNSCTRLKDIDASSSVSFKNLMTLHVTCCDKLENLVTISTAKNMVHLMELRITYCEMMKEIVANNGDDPECKITFDHLKRLELRYLPTLYSFCSGNYIFHFPLLEEVIIEDCLHMKFFCGGVLSTPKLGGVQHWKFKEEVQYWDGNLNATIASQCFRKKVLQNAYNWYVIEDPSFSKAILANQLEFLNELRYLYVRDCDSAFILFDLEDVFVERGHAGLLPQLKDLRLINLPKLSELWNKDPMRMFDFRNLRWLKVQNCSSLKYVFTQSMVSSLFELQMIEVKNCKVMEAIIKEEEAKETELPSLKKISIKGCPSMKDFIFPVLSREQNPRPDEEKIRKQIIDMQERHEILMPRLEELRIDWDIIKHKLHSNHQSDFFRKPKVIELVFPFNSFPIMEKLVLNDALVEELIIYGLDNHHKLLPRLRKIILSKLPNLKHMVYDDDPRRVFVFQNLQVLQVWDCSSLKTLVSSFVYFQNLTFLQLSKCDGLINLITVSTAKSLVQLKKMYIGRCKIMQEIVVAESDREEDEIGFLQLEYLVLDDLPRLTSFCSSENSFDFPCLEEMFVIKCPNMKMFAQVLNTPKLSQVQTGGNEYEWEWEGSLNSTIQALSMKRKKYMREILRKEIG